MQGIVLYGTGDVRFEDVPEAKISRAYSGEKNDRKRLDLSPRDRGVITVAALIARIQTIEMPFHFALTLDNGNMQFYAAKSSRDRSQNASHKDRNK